MTRKKCSLSTCNAHGDALVQTHVNRTSPPIVGWRCVGFSSRTLEDLTPRGGSSGSEGLVSAGGHRSDGAGRRACSPAQTPRPAPPLPDPSPALVLIGLATDLARGSCVPACGRLVRGGRSLAAARRRVSQLSAAASHQLPPHQLRLLSSDKTNACFLRLGEREMPLQLRGQGEGPAHDEEGCARAFLLREIFLLLRDILCRSWRIYSCSLLPTHGRADNCLC